MTKLTPLVLLAVACAGLQPRNAADDVIATIERLRVGKKIPGLAVAIVDGEEIVAVRGLGLANIERGIAVTGDTPFNIASVTKPVSAVVALRLAEGGALELDRPMQRFANFNEFCAAATAEGGIFFGDVRCGDQSLTLRRVLSMSANGEPGTRLWYNPPLYSWASRPMAEVAGKPFSDLVDELIFRPTGMTRSARIHRRLPLRDDLAQSLATPYHLDERGNAVVSDPPPPQGDGAAGGVISTAHDLARFDIALSRGQLLDTKSLADMWSPSRTRDGAPLPYGVGWFLGEYKGNRIAWHTGLWEGQYSALYLTKFRNDGRRTTLILLANSDGLRWPSRLDEAAIERSPFATAFLDSFD